MLLALAVISAAALGACGPAVLRRIPEPPEPDPDKEPYASLAEARFLLPGLALAAAVMAGVVCWRIDTPELFPVWVLVSGVGAWLGFIDWHTRLLPFVIVAPLYLATVALVVLAAVLLDDRDLLVRAAVANVVVYAAFRLLHWLGGRFFGGAFGYGDVRLSGVLALALGALGASEVFVGVYGGFVLGALLGLVLARLRIIDPRSYAFGPYMVAAAAIGAAWGPSIYQV